MASAAAHCAVPDSVPFATYAPVALTSRYSGKIAIRRVPVPPPDSALGSAV